MKTLDVTKAQHAVVIGASIGGLLAARVLSEHFEQITLIEKDVVNNFPEARKGQPHVRHLHGLLAHGFDIFSAYFPGLKMDLMEGGAIVRDMGLGMRWFINGGYRKPVNFNKEGVLVSRPFLEFLIRKAVLNRHNINLIDQCTVKALQFDEGCNRVTGLELNHQLPNEKPKQINADLVVDASGRGTAMPKWLEKAGYSKPKETNVKVKLGYATCILERNPDLPGSKDWVFVTPGNKTETRMGGAFPIEGDRWLVTLAGMSGDYPGSEKEAFYTFAKNLPAPDVYEIICQNEALTDVISYKFPNSKRQHYEKLGRFPEGLLVFGDAICSFNPIYGQGMTVAAMEARLLDQLLQKRNGQLNGLAKAFFKKAKSIIDIPWQTAVGEDFRYPGTEGRKPPGTDFINAYISRIHKASHHDEVVCSAFLKVMNLLRPPTSLFSPRILWRTLFAPRPSREVPIQVGQVEEAQSIV